MTDYDERGPVRDEKGRLLDVSWDATEEEIAAAIARRDEADARNLEALRAAGRLFNVSGWYDRDDRPTTWR